jgi:predicted RNA-binding Zn-ribbon protein involved in translation (DUF1610 family)
LRFGPLLEYFCSCCSNVLKKNTTLEVQNHQVKEECPSCGALLIDTVQNKRKLSVYLSEQDHVVTCIIGKQKYTQLLIDRLCVHSLLPRRHRGIGLDYSNIMSLMLAIVQMYISM